MRPAIAANQEAIIVIHGGAGVDSGMDAKDQTRHEEALNSALLAAYAVWKQGGEAVEIVEAAVKQMEDCPLFNAGKGAVFNCEGKNELDAAIMDGRTRQAGAVAGVTIVKNPIVEAITVMRKSGHVMLVGQGADKFAIEQKLEIVDPKYFWTENRWNDFQKKMKQKNLNSSSAGYSHKYGTVGAVALDTKGNLAAGTSTGGLTGKRQGRVGDSPVIGAGTFADNKTCAVSCTGEGEWFIRFNAASDVSARMRYAHESVKDAAEQVIHQVLGPGHGEGGLIAIDRNGRFAMPFNTAGMFRGYIGKDGKPHTFVY